MQPPQPPRGMYPGGGPSPGGRTNPGIPGLSQSSFGQAPMGPGPLPPLPPPNLGTSPGLGPVPAGLSEVRTAAVVRRQPVYYGVRRLTRGRGYTFTVRIEAEKNAQTEVTGAEPLVTVQPIIPGAVVAPSTADVPLTPGSEAVFSLLPLAVGKVSGARIDILRQSRKLTSLKVPLRVSRGWFMTIMALIAILALLLVKSSWQPRYVMITERTAEAAAPKLDPDGNPLPAEKPKLQRLETVYEGREAIEKYINVNAGRLGYPPEAANPAKGVGAWDSYDFLMAGLYYARPGLLYAYDGLETARKTPLGDLYVLGIICALALIVAFLRRGRRVRVPGPVLEVRA
jgi:hypothetical protein